MMETPSWIGEPDGPVLAEALDRLGEMLGGEGMSFITLRSRPALVVPLAEGRVDLEVAPIVVGSDDLVVKLAAVVIDQIPYDALSRRDLLLLNDYNIRAPGKWYWMPDLGHIAAVSDLPLDGLTGTLLGRMLSELAMVVDHFAEPLADQLHVGRRPVSLLDRAFDGDDSAGFAFDGP
jgi:hypothetical protein